LFIVTSILWIVFRQLRILGENMKKMTTIITLVLIFIGSSLNVHALNNNDSKITGGVNATKENLTPPTNLTAQVMNHTVNLQWNAPDNNLPDEDMTEGFENSFPPHDWNVIETSQFQNWQRVQTLLFTTGNVNPHSGSYQAFVGWSSNHQDEWLITPQFTCPQNGLLSFYTFAFMGSTDLDHYYVKVSADGGTSWDILWDASSIQPAGQYTYESGPILISLNAYAGQQIKLAWQGIDGDGHGLWYVWAVDDVAIGNDDSTIRFDAADFTHISKSFQPTPISNIGSYPSKHEYLLSQNGIQTNDNKSKSDIVKNEQQGRYQTGYNIYRDGNIINVGGVQTVPFYQDIDVPYGQHIYKVTAVYTDGESIPTNEVTIHIQEPPSSFTDSFEDYTDFSLSMPPWTMVDSDHGNTSLVSSYSFPNAGLPMAFTCFNPLATSPIWVDIAAHTGNKFAACFSSANPPNNDWMITPLLEIKPNTTLCFYAKSHTLAYGLEKFRVGVSTLSSSPTDMVLISGDEPTEVPTVWTLYNYSLGAYSGHFAYIGIQCVSNDAYIFMVDDVRIEETLSTEDPTVLPTVSNLSGNYPNPFNPSTTIRYSVKEKGSVKLDIYNSKGQKVKSLVNESKAAGNYNIVWDGRDDQNRSVASGVYFYRMTCDSYSATKKMIMMK